MTGTRAILASAASYEYRILNRRASLTLERGRVWRIGPELDADRDARGGATARGPA